MARALESGFVMTVEPGLYFIPALVEKWRKEKKHTSFISYDRVEKFMDFGGARIEDDVLVTAGSWFPARGGPAALAEAHFAHARGVLPGDTVRPLLNGVPVDIRATGTFRAL